VLLAALSFIIYAAFGIRGWIGFRKVYTGNEDDTYWAAVYSHSNLLLPFITTQDVLVPSANDLNSHIVFRTTGLLQNFKIQWLDQRTLQIVCSRCSQSELLQSKVDEIDIELVRR
jgi:hypothetical protein